MLFVFIILSVFGFILLMFAISMFTQLWPLFLIGAVIGLLLARRRR